MDPVVKGIIIAFGIAIAFLVVVILAVVFVTWMRREKQGYPHEQKIEAMLLPWALRAIAAGYRASEYWLDVAQERLSGAEKKEWAAKFYFRLPESLRGAVSQDEFCRLVESAFAELESLLRSADDQLDDAFKKWYDENMT